MGQGRRQSNDEFKREAVVLLASSGQPLTQIASELYIRHRPLDAAQLAQSRRRTECGAGAAPDTGVGPAFLYDLVAEISRLRRENDRLPMESGILKGCGHLLGTVLQVNDSGNRIVHAFLPGFQIERHRPPIAFCQGFAASLRRGAPGCSENGE